MLGNRSHYSAASCLDRGRRRCLQEVPVEIHHEGRIQYLRLGRYLVHRVIRKGIGIPAERTTIQALNYLTFTCMISCSTDDQGTWGQRGRPRRPWQRRPEALELRYSHHGPCGHTGTWKHLGLAPVIAPTPAGTISTDFRTVLLIERAHARAHDPLKLRLSADCTNGGSFGPRSTTAGSLGGDIEHGRFFILLNLATIPNPHATA